MSLVNYSTRDGIACLALNRPSRHNALVPELLDELLDKLDLCRQEQPAVLILEAEGGSFSSGGDVAGFYDTPRGQRGAYAARVVGALNQVILSLLDLPMPTIASVQGLVSGGSLGLVLACDLVVASEQARFEPWYSVVGFSPDGGWSALLPERIGRSRALEVQLTNRSISANEAHILGLVQYHSDHINLPLHTWKIASSLLEKRPGSLRHTLALGRPDRARVAAGLEAEYRHFLEQIESDEADRGMAAFLKR